MVRSDLKIWLQNNEKNIVLDGLSWLIWFHNFQASNVPESFISIWYASLTLIIKKIHINYEIELKIFYFLL